MYPTISDLIKDIFGINVPLPVQSFGFFVAVSFVVAAWLVLIELKRKEREGIIVALKKKVVVGKPASAQELIIMGLFGFIIGFKLLGIIFNYISFAENPQHFIFSGEGNIFGGILGAVALAYMKYRDKQKSKLDKPRTEEVEVHPYELTGNIILYGALFGIIGAKIFDNLENIDKFIDDPVGSLFSFSGLTFYGGLILAAIAIIWYARKNNIPALVISDVAAPAIMIAYAVGRIGCQVAGDGDWGILNSAYVTNSETKVELAQGTQFNDTLNKYEYYYIKEFPINNVNDVPHLYVKAPLWLPDWMFAYSYPNNVLNSGAENQNLKSKNDKYYSQLPIPVFPTPLYEIITCGILFALLWIFRRKMKIIGMMFSVFLIINGVERFFVEKIRVNTKYNIFGWQITQAEIISTLLFITGVLLLVFIIRNNKKKLRLSEPKPDS